MMPFSISSITLAGIDRVLAFRPLLEPGTLRAQVHYEIRHKSQGGVVTWHSTEDHDLDAFVRVCHEEHVVVSFDWSKWMSGPGRAFAKPSDLDRATVRDCLRMLTALIRKERICQGTLHDHVSTGFLGALLDRLASHRHAFL